MRSSLRWHRSLLCTLTCVFLRAHQVGFPITFLIVSCPPSLYLAVPSLGFPGLRQQLGRRWTPPVSPPAQIASGTARAPAAAPPPAAWPRPLQLPTQWRSARRAFWQGSSSPPRPDWLLAAAALPLLRAHWLLSRAGPRLLRRAVPARRV